jgi:hypothetical protein
MVLNTKKDFFSRLVLNSNTLAPNCLPVYTLYVWVPYISQSQQGIFIMRFTEYKVNCIFGQSSHYMIFANAIKWLGRDDLGGFCVRVLFYALVVSDQG